MNKTLLRSFLVLAIPTVLENFMTTILQYIDTAMVGHLGAQATAAVSLSTTYNWFFGSLIGAIGMGFLAYIARAIGEGDEAKIKGATGLAFTSAFVIGAVLTIVTMIIAPLVPVWMGAEESIRFTGTWYFRLINMPMVFRAFMTIFASVLRSTGDTKTPMKINVLVNIMNIILNYLFIYVFAMEAIGAGIATALSFTFGGIMMFLAYKKSSYVSMQKKYLQIKGNEKILRDICAIGLPAMATNAVSCLGYIVSTSFVSSMAIVVYAAHSIAITAEQIFYIPGYGMQAATSTLIGNSLGEKNLKKEHDIMKISLSIIFVIMCVSGVLLFVGSDFMMSLFTKDEEVIRIGGELLRLVAFTEPLFGASAVMEGIYIGLGKTQIPLGIELVTRWGIRIGGATIFVAYLGKGIIAYWWCMVADNICKSLLLATGVLLLVAKEKKAKEVVKDV